jgi:putative transposase
MLAHKIKLNPNNIQRTYFQKASGIARFSWNWGLARWNELYKVGEKPSGMSLKKEFNSLKKSQFPFVGIKRKSYYFQREFLIVKNVQ